MLGMFTICEFPLSVAKPILREWQHEVIEHRLWVKNEGEGDGRVRKLQVDGFDFLTKVKVKIRSKGEVEVDEREKI